jgi:DNA-binding transcriptional MerR regulator
VNERPFLSIGEVLGLLLEEFPDITISKIRFLESQGLIEPERTASGYRKFYDADVERLRFILREQRENYLPLRVIRARLGDTPPGGIPRSTNGTRTPGDDTQRDMLRPGDAPVPVTSTYSHPSAQSRASVVAELVEAPPAPQPHLVPVANVTEHVASRPAISPDTTGSLTRDLSTYLTRAELLSATGATSALLQELEEYGLVAPKASGTQTLYEPIARTVVELAAGFADLGIDVRHLRTWRTAAEREAGFFEARISPMMRQRNPEARDASVEILEQLMDLGGRLRHALVEQSLRRYIDPH